jgi:hypothetical protein
VAERLHAEAVGAAAAAEPTAGVLGGDLGGVGSFAAAVADRVGAVELGEGRETNEGSPREPALGCGSLACAGQIQSVENALPHLDASLIAMPEGRQGNCTGSRERFDMRSPVRYNTNISSTIAASRK